MTPASEHQAQQFIRRFTTAIATIRLYNATHPQVKHLCRQAMDLFPTLVHGTEGMTLKLINDKLICQNLKLADNLSVERLIKTMREHQLNFIELKPDITIEDLLELAGRLSNRRPQTEPVSATGRIGYGQVAVRNHRSSRPSAESTVFQEVAEQNLDKFMDIYQNIGSNKQIHAGGIGEIVNSFISAFSEQGNLMSALAPLRTMDEYLYTHSTNICLLNLAQAKLLGIDGPMLNDIGIAAMLHDAGKMFIPSEILNKQGKLDDREWELMRSHPRLGAQYLLGCPGIPRLAVVTAYEHHIGYDGTGYPASYRKLNPCSYMTSISDIYDALRTRRAYKEPLHFDQIHSIMSGSAGKALHPHLTHSFLCALSRLENPETLTQET